MHQDFNTGFSKFYNGTATPSVSPKISGQTLLIGIVAGIAVAVVFYKIGRYNGMTKMYHLMIAQNAEKNSVNPSAKKSV